jgi:hypothetical protein
MLLEIQRFRITHPTTTTDLPDDIAHKKVFALAFRRPVVEGCFDREAKWMDSWVSGDDTEDCRVAENDIHFIAFICIARV